jgi:hypothetical protein
MIRIIIEIDDKQVSVTAPGPVAAPAPSTELLTAPMELGATSAGGAPGDAIAAAAFASSAASDAGAAPEVGAAAARPGAEPKPKRTTP